MQSTSAVIGLLETLPQIKKTCILFRMNYINELFVLLCFMLLWQFTEQAAAASSTLVFVTQAIRLCTLTTSCVFGLHNPSWSMLTSPQTTHQKFYTLSYMCSFSWAACGTLNLPVWLLETFSLYLSHLPWRTASSTPEAIIVSGKTVGLQRVFFTRRNLSAENLQRRCNGKSSNPIRPHKSKTAALGNEGKERGNAAAHIHSHQRCHLQYSTTEWDMHADNINY